MDYVIIPYDILQKNVEGQWYTHCLTQKGTFSPL